jgi:transposase, IS30 family
MRKSLKYRHLSRDERVVIEKMYGAGSGIRAIARTLGRSPNSISRELRDNRVRKRYCVDKAQHKAYLRRYRSKRDCMKVVTENHEVFVQEKLKLKWSPRQISGYMKKHHDVVVSAKAIYKYTRSRCLEHLLFWGWNKQKSGRKQYKGNGNPDGRKRVDERPEVTTPGHYEMDFIVSKGSLWVLLVLVDRMTKETCVIRLTNRRYDTIRKVLQRFCRSRHVVNFTTDNDIAFTKWRELEEACGIQIYFCYPYHSWEKGLVENTNRWIRCFVSKKRDVASVSDEELDTIHTFINDRPRAIIGFYTPSEYYQLLTTSVSYLGGS